MSSHATSSSPLPSFSPTTPARADSEVPKSWRCSCGTGDGSGAYIECDNPDCRVGWYHWECVQVTEEVVGTWLCPSCSPNAAFYIKQLVKKRPIPPVTPNSRKAATPTSRTEKERELVPRSERSKATTATISRKKEQVPRAATPIISKTEQTAAPASVTEKEYRPAADKAKPVKKGVATKKSVPEKPKPKWIGWVEIPSDDEEEYRTKVDAQWRDDTAHGRRTRVSKPKADEDEIDSRTPRTRRRAAEKRRVVESDSDEGEGMDEEDFGYQEKDEEEDEDATSSSAEASMYGEAAVSDDASVDEDASVEDEESASRVDEEDSMSIDEESEREDDDSTEDMSEHPLNIEDEKSDVSEEADSDVPWVIRRRSSAATRTAPTNSHATPESADLPRQTSSHGDSEYQPDSSMSPTSDTSSDDSTGSSPVPPASALFRSEDMEVDDEDDGQRHVTVTVTPAVESDNYAALYRHSGNYWGEFPESAVRSTLPRLG